jgi:signal recognition particle subunit SRP54
MVLAELGSKITSALTSLANRPVIDQEAVDALMKEICNALVSADVNFKLVMQLRTNIKNKINVDDMPAGINKRTVIQKIVFQELCGLLDPGVKPFTPVKGKQNIFMFVGLQGSGKTTTVTKLAHYYKRKGWKAALVCADTFRAGAFDQLKQNAAKVMVPFYGSYSETDPAKIAADGVSYFRKEGYEIIIVDTSGRHKQEADLFEEMRLVDAAVSPDEIIFVLDSTIGQAAFDQAQAFKNSVKVGSLVITKMDSHAKGGGALSAVAATKSPIVFIGTGEHFDDFEPFAAQGFVRQLLGMGNIDLLVDRIKDAVGPNIDDQKDLRDKLLAGSPFTLRDMYEQFQNILKMGPLNKVMEAIPGFSQMLKQTGGSGKDFDSGQKIRSYITMMDSMTDDELDDNRVLQDKKTRDSRIHRIARGSGRSLREVNELLEQFKHFEKMMGKFKNLKIPKSGQINQRGVSQIGNMLPPHVMKQMGGPGAIQNLLKSMGGGDLASMAKKMMGGE